MTPITILGALAGVGVWLMVTAVVPAKPGLAQVLADLEGRPAPPLAPPASLDERLGRALAGWVDTGRLARGHTRADLAVLEIEPATFLGSKLAAASSLLLVAPALAGVAAVAGFAVSWQLPTVAGLALAGLGFVIPDVDLHRKAEARRRQLRRGLSSFLNVVALGLASGELISGALRIGAAAGHGPVFTLVRRAVADAEARGLPPWDALASAAETRGLNELAEVAASVRLAGTSGAHVRRTLEAKADGLRTRALADMATDANEASTRMVLPLIGVAAGFLVLIAYPAIVHILGGN